jgi:hypothetical protein
LPFALDLALETLKPQSPFHHAHWLVEVLLVTHGDDLTVGKLRPVLMEIGVDGFEALPE